MKSKSKSRTKPQIIPQIENSHEQEKEISCAICRFPIKNITKGTLRCQECKKYIHMACYNPEYQSTGKPFVCDLCGQKKKKGGKQHGCVICHQIGKEQILKTIQNGSNNSLVHVDCALFSPYVEIQSYSKLNFSKKDGDKSSKWDCCGQTYFGPVVNCVQCAKKGHYRCLIVEFGEVGDFAENYLISKWLDKCERYDFLLNNILNKKKSPIKNLVDEPCKWKQGQLMVCSAHKDNYPWCPCNKKEISNEIANPSYGCDICGRYYHQPCSGLPPNTDKDFICNGCKQKNIFEKELKPHELMQQISKIQKSSKWDQATFRFLNAFPFKYSSTLEKKIQQNLKQIQIYFLKRQISKILQQSNLSEKSTKKFIHILLYLVYAQKWKDMEQKWEHKQQQIQNIINQILSSMKKYKFPKQNIEKTKEILNGMKSHKPHKQIKTKQYQQLKQELKKFIKKWKSNENVRHRSSCEEFATSLKHVQDKFIEIMADMEAGEKKKFLNAFNQALGNEIFGVIISHKISHEVLVKILQKYSRVKFYLNQNHEVQETQYYSLLNKSCPDIPNQDKEGFQKCMRILKIQASKLNLIYSGIKKEQAIKTNEAILKQKKWSDKALRSIQNQLILENICTVGDTTFTNSGLNFIEFNVYKKKYLKIANQIDDDISDDSLKNAYHMHDFIRKRKNLLIKQERKLMESYIGKIQFLFNIIKKASNFLSNPARAQQNRDNNNNSEDKIDEQAPPQEPNALFKQLFIILDQCDELSLTSQTIIEQICNYCVAKNVKFDKSQVYEKMGRFIGRIIEKFKRGFDMNRKIYSNQLIKIVKILKYLKLEQEYPYFIDLYNQVRKWAEILPEEENVNNIDAFLEKTDKIPNFIKLLEAKISAAEQIKPVNLNPQIRKLCLLRQWFRLTEKMALLAKSKPTIYGIQTLKSLLDKTYYPQNNLYRKVSELEIESQSLNREVARFLQKPKIPERSKFFDEIKIISTKLTLQQGNTIKTVFQSSNLDLCIQKQQLQTEIQQFHKLPANIGSNLNRQTLEQLQSIRKKIIDSCFRPNNMFEYEQFLRKIYVLRCINFQPPITREQYFELLAIGGSSALILENRTADLHRTYKVIQKAELQLANPLKNRNAKNLLPWSQIKYKEMKQDLRYDPTQLSKLQKARIHNLKIRQEYSTLRSRKTKIQKYQQIEYELQSSIFNNRDLINQILTLRTDVSNLKQKIQDILPYTHPNNPKHSIYSQNIFRKQKNLVQICGNLLISNPILDQFENDGKNYRRAQQLRSNLSIESYRNYSEICCKISDIGCKIPQFLNTRAKIFLDMAQNVLNVQQYHMQLYQVLINEGLELRRLNASQKHKIFEIVIKVYEKIREATNQNGQQRQQISDGDQQNDESVDNNEDDQEDNENESDEDDYESDSNMSQSQDYDDDDDDEDGEDNRDKNGNQIVLDSD